MRRLLIFTAEYTGHGHKSISDALMERLSVYDDLEIKCIDGFDLMDKIMKACAEKTYGPITRMPGRAWEWNYAAGLKLKQPVQAAVRMMIRTRFEKLIEEFRPDCILSVHPIFISTVLDLLETMHLNIPVVAHEADLVDIPPLWFDRRLSLILAPSEEARACSLRYGMDPDRVRTVGFPVRSRFMGLRDAGRSNPDGALTITVMSGSEGSGSLKQVVNYLLEGTDSHVNVVCGRNKALRKKLREAFARKFYGRINVLGFVDEIQKIMIDSDVLVLRASPNSVMEAVALNKPVILFGQLAGQELHNPDMVQAHGLGVYCPNPEDLPGCIRELSANGREKIEQMCAAQRAYAPGDAAADTAKLLNDYIQPYPWEK